jgi:hypothetical protein
MRSNQAYLRPEERIRSTLETALSNNKKDDMHMKPELFLIRVKGHLGEQWTEWFDGFTITNVEHGEAIICGTNIDQAALHGVLMKVRDLGLPLLAVSLVNVDETTVAEGKE